MISKHQQFIEAIHAQKKVCVRFYSKADSGVLDRVCAPMDYGPGGEIKDGLNRYWLWDYAADAQPHTLGLVSQQILDLQVLGEVFDPSQLGDIAPQWSIPRAWTGHPQPRDEPSLAPASSAVATQTSGPQTQQAEFTPAEKK